MTQETQDASPAAAAPDTGNGLWLRRLQHRYTEQVSATSSTQSDVPPSDADKYRWIRANRGNFAITEALAHSARDADFDEQIAAAMRMSAAGRHYYSRPHGLLR